MKQHCTIISVLLILVFTAGCTTKTDSPKVVGDREPVRETKIVPPENNEWSLSYGMTGGIAGFRDSIKVTPDGSAVFSKAGTVLDTFTVKESTVEDLKWIVSRQDVLDAVGDYKSGGEVADDITCTLDITVGEKLYHISWAYRSDHPACLDEIRPALDRAIDEVRDLTNYGAPKQDEGQQ